MEPTVALLSQDYEGLMKVGKIDVDASPDLARQFEVSGVPAFLLFRGGDVIERNIGLKQYSEMRHWLDQEVGAPSSPAM
jgi:thioredoxin-like negative regulator of GroEL